MYKITDKIIDAVEARIAEEDEQIREWESKGMPSDDPIVGKITYRDDYERMLKEEMEKIKAEYGGEYTVRFICESYETHYAIGYTKDGEICIIPMVYVE